MRNRFGRTAGAAIGAVIFVMFCASLANRLVNPVSAAERESDVTVTVIAR